MGSNVFFITNTKRLLIVLEWIQTYGNVIYVSHHPPVPLKPRFQCEFSFTAVIITADVCSLCKTSFFIDFFPLTVIISVCPSLGL